MNIVNHGGIVNLLMTEAEAIEMKRELKRLKSGFMDGQFCYFSGYYPFLDDVADELRDVKEARLYQ